MTKTPSWIWAMVELPMLFQTRVPAKPTSPADAPDWLSEISKMFCVAMTWSEPVSPMWMCAPDWICARVVFDMTSMSIAPPIPDLEACATLEERLGEALETLLEVEEPGYPDIVPSGVSLDVQRLGWAAEAAVLVDECVADGRFDVVVPVMNVDGPGNADLGAAGRAARGRVGRSAVGGSRGDVIGEEPQGDRDILHKAIDPGGGQSRHVYSIGLAYQLGHGERIGEFGLDGHGACRINAQRCRRPLP